MKRNAKTVTRKTVLLTDPLPHFSSLVPSGANGTPWLALKSEEQIQEAPMAKKLKHGNADIARITFRGESFDTEDKVKAWLDDGGYADVAIKAEEDGSFTVAGDEALTDTADIDLDNGVTVTVGKAADETDDNANGDVVAIDGQKADEPKTGAGRVSREKAEERAIADSKLTKDEWASLKQETRDKYIDLAAEDIATEEAAKDDTADTDPAADAVQPVAADAPADAPVDAKDDAADPAAPPAPPDELPVLLVKGEDGLFALADRKGTYDITDLTYVIQTLGFIKTNAEWAAYNGDMTPEVAANLRDVIRQIGDILIAFAAAEVAWASKSETGADANETGETQPTEASKASEPSAQPASIAGMDAVLAAIADLGKEVASIKSIASKSAEKAEALDKRMDAVEKSTVTTRKSADVEELAESSRITPTSKTTSAKSDVEISESVRARNSNNLIGL